jgi:hypothetical protein
MKGQLLTSPSDPGKPSFLVDAALAYVRRGWSVIPLSGKRPAVRWKPFQHDPASEAQVLKWHDQGLLSNVGLVCGTASRQLVVLDIDSHAGYLAFAAAFPILTETRTVRTGSGRGRHLYWYVKQLPATVRVRSPALGSIELLAQGCQVVAPPSIHPQTRDRYRVDLSYPLLTLIDVDVVCTWLSGLRQMRFAQPSRPTLAPRHHGYIRQEDIIAVLTEHFTRHNYRPSGPWLNGPCVFPHQHRHGDAHPSFGFNTRSGFGFCFVCGAVSPVEICSALNIRF